MKALDLLDEWTLELEIQNYSPRTITTYRNKNKLLLSFAKKENIAEITHLSIKTYINSLIKRKCKTAYINSTIKCFKAFF